MMIVVGIDEAGYGPLLGPLVVSATAFEIPDELIKENLWSVLSDGVCQEPARHETRLPIADSKKLFNRKKGIDTLERTALVMLKAAGRSPKCLRDIIQILAPEKTEQLSRHPWYAEYDCVVPTSTSNSDIATRANAIKRCLSAQNVSIRGIFCEIVSEGDFNRRIKITRNKATVLLQAGLRLIQRIQSRMGASMVVHVDRQGGRAKYREALMTFFEGQPLRVNSETSTYSAYTLGEGNHSWSIDFTTQGESSHLPIALASIFSKYLRELFMGAVNSYFRSRVNDLTPTAGYYTDAKRFLADIAPAVKREKIDQTLLVRSR
jgi:ribonuclease HII